MGWYVTAQADATLGIIGFPINEVWVKSNQQDWQRWNKRMHTSYIYVYIDKNDDDGSDNDDDMDVVP